MLKEFSYGIIPLRKEGDKWEVFLIQHKGGNHWAFPKGHPLPHEAPRESAIRELKEETGLDIATFIPSTASFEEHYFFTFHKERIEKKVLYFPALVQGTVSLQREEVQDGKWIALEEAEEHLTFTEGKKMCRQLLALI